MKKVLALVIVLSVFAAVSFPVKAAEDRSASVFPGLSFSGTTATCSLRVYASHTTDTILAAVTLKHGSSTVKQWTNLTAYGTMNFSDTAPVSHGETYTMQVTLEINGVSYSVADITKTCP
ncbi:MAG: hypothetical protein J6U66_05805 [Lachnospiraceae bacterium]|nr:hypothetical protein [Lachnospiraceae bacterium]